MRRVLRTVRQHRQWLTVFAAGLLLLSRGSAAQALEPAVPCIGDCSATGAVTTDELLTMTRIALGEGVLAECPAGDADGDGTITVDEFIAAISNALDGCPTAQPLVAAIDFAQPREAINPRLLGTGGASPLAPVNQLLQSVIQPPLMRLDVGFEDTGCPDDPSAGPLYDAPTNTFNYCRLDQRLEQARATGATPLLIIDYTPLALIGTACAASNGHGFGAQHCPPTDYDKYGALVTAMMQHVYTTYHVTDFEVWNEPDGIYFAGTLTDYLQLYRTANTALLDAEASLHVPAGTLRLGGPATTIAHRSWFTALLAQAVADPQLRLDFLSWHNYANQIVGSQPNPALSAGTYADDTEKVRGWLAVYQAQRTDLHPELWIDEWNVNAFFDPRMDTSYAAAFTVAALHAMQDAGTDAAGRFNTWDSSEAGPASFNGNWGLFTHDGAVRPALDAFYLWRQFAAQRVGVELLDPLSRGRAATTRTRYAQNVLASADTTGQHVSILIYNFIPYSAASSAAPFCGGGPPLHAQLALRGLANGVHEVRRLQIDCSVAIQPIDGALPAPLASTLAVGSDGGHLDLRVPADAIVLLTVSR